MGDATGMPQPHRGSSRTAEFVALFRALESRLSADQRLFDDPYAHAFLGTRLRAVLALARVPVTGRLLIEAIDRGWPGARVSVVVRTRFIDDALKEALADGIDQVAIIGSGFDTRPYRVPGAERAQIFEIDTPGTLHRTRTRIEALLGQLPPHVSTGIPSVGGPSPCASTTSRSPLARASSSRTSLRARRFWNRENPSVSRRGAGQRSQGCGRRPTRQRDNRSRRRWFGQECTTLAQGAGDRVLIRRRRAPSGRWRPPPRKTERLYLWVGDRGRLEFSGVWGADSGAHD
jgi:leucine carboxyl methyltransferase